MRPPSPQSIRRLHAYGIARAEAVLVSWTPDLVPLLLPDGRRVGDEWVCRNPTRDDVRPGSFSINLRTGRWADFATNDRGRDVISLAAYLMGCSRRAALYEIASAVALTGTI